MSTHTGEKNVVCNICGYRFYNKNMLKRHLISHDGSKNFKCEICGTCFNRKWNMQQHVRKVHGDRSHIPSRKKAFDVDPELGSELTVPMFGIYHDKCKNQRVNHLELH